MVELPLATEVPCSQRCKIVQLALGVRLHGVLSRLPAGWANLPDSMICFIVASRQHSIL